MFPILMKEIPHFLGAATIAIQTITQHLEGLADLELEWSKSTGACWSDLHKIIL